MELYISEISVPKIVTLYLASASVQWRSSLRILGGVKLVLILVYQVWSLLSTIAAMGVFNLRP